MSNLLNLGSAVMQKLPCGTVVVHRGADACAAIEAERRSIARADRDFLRGGPDPFEPGPHAPGFRTQFFKQVRGRCLEHRFDTISESLAEHLGKYKEQIADKATPEDGLFVRTHGMVWTRAGRLLSWP